MQNLRNTNGDLHAAYLYVDGPAFFGITPHVMIKMDIPFDRDVLEGGFLYRIGGKSSVKIAEQPIDINISVGGHDGAYGLRPELMSSWRVTVSSTLNV